MISGEQLLLSSQISTVVLTGFQCQLCQSWSPLNDFAHPNTTYPHFVMHRARFCCWFCMKITPSIYGKIKFLSALIWQQRAEFRYLIIKPNSYWIPASVFHITNRLDKKTSGARIVNASKARSLETKIRRAKWGFTWDKNRQMERGSLVLSGPAHPICDGLFLSPCRPSYVFTVFLWKNINKKSTFSIAQLH